MRGVWKNLQSCNRTITPGEKNICTSRKLKEDVWKNSKRNPKVDRQKKVAQKLLFHSILSMSASSKEVK